MVNKQTDEFRSCFHEFVFECAANVARYIRATGIVHKKGKVGIGGVFAYERNIIAGLC